MKFLPWICLGIGCYTVINGILHTVFVLAEKRPYDRDLLRLIMDGHTIFFVGVFEIIAFFGLKAHEQWGYWVAGTACCAMLIYSALIFPFLKSIGMIFWHLLLLILLFFG